jgi:hypothetical protein
MPPLQYQGFLRPLAGVSSTGTELEDISRLAKFRLAQLMREATTEEERARVLELDHRAGRDLNLRLELAQQSEVGPDVPPTEKPVPRVPLAPLTPPTDSPTDEADRGFLMRGLFNPDLSDPWTPRNRSGSIEPWMLAATAAGLGGLLLPEPTTSIAGAAALARMLPLLSRAGGIGFGGLGTGRVLEGAKRWWQGEPGAGEEIERGLWDVAIPAVGRGYRLYKEGTRVGGVPQIIRDKFGNVLPGSPTVPRPVPAPRQLPELSESTIRAQRAVAAARASGQGIRTPGALTPPLQIRGSVSREALRPGQRPVSWPRPQPAAGTGQSRVQWGGSPSPGPRLDPLKEFDRRIFMGRRPVGSPGRVPPPPLRQTPERIGGFSTVPRTTTMTSTPVGSQFGFSLPPRYGPGAHSPPVKSVARATPLTPAVDPAVETATRAAGRVILPESAQTVTKVAEESVETVVKREGDRIAKEVNPPPTPGAPKTVFNQAPNDRVTNVFSTLNNQYQKGTGKGFSFWGETREARKHLLPALAYVTRVIGKITPATERALLEGSEKEVDKILARILDDPARRSSQGPMTELFGTVGPGTKAAARRFEEFAPINPRAVAAAEQAHPGVPLKFPVRGPIVEPGKKKAGELAEAAEKFRATQFKGATGSELTMAKNQFRETLKAVTDDETLFKPLTTGEQDAMIVYQMALNRFVVLRDLLQGFMRNGLETATARTAEMARELYPRGVHPALIGPQKAKALRADVFDVATGTMEKGKQSMYAELDAAIGGMLNKGVFSQKPKMLELINALKEMNAGLLLFLGTLTGAQVFDPQAVFQDDIGGAA